MSSLPMYLSLFHFDFKLDNKILENGVCMCTTASIVAALESKLHPRKSST